MAASFERTQAFMRLGRYKSQVRITKITKTAWKPYKNVIYFIK